ncbi:MAG TPA: hypothetical protein VE077_08230 [Candidatus Methylomirabilis sp.]|nr:hypothetical protein [Candidatus Methylomirabilis sp.]
MKRLAAKSSLAALGLISLFVVIEPCSAASSSRQQSPAATSPACSASEYRQFDFWLGDWDAYDLTTNAKDSRVRVTRILDGCVIHEDYQSVDGHRGESFSIYDASRKLWHQTWVTNRGRLLVIEGRFENDSMVMSGADRTAAGQERIIRGIWKPVEGGVRETAYTSLDAGKTWQLWFDLFFRPHQ